MIERPPIREIIRDISEDLIRGVAAPPTPFEYFLANFTETGGADILVQNYTPDIHPAGGAFSNVVPTSGVGDPIVFRVNYVLDRLEVNSLSGTDGGYVRYTFGETLQVSAFDWRWWGNQYIGWGDGGTQTYAAGGTIGMAGQQAVDSIKLYAPGGVQIVSCPAQTDGVMYKKQITYDGANVRYYLADTLILTVPHTDPFTLTYIHFWATTFGASRPAWDTMSFWAHGLRP